MLTWRLPYIHEEPTQCLSSVCVDIKHSVIDKTFHEWQCVRCQGMTR